MIQVFNGKVTGNHIRQVYNLLAQAPRRADEKLVSQITFSLADSTEYPTQVSFDLDGLYPLQTPVSVTIETKES